MRVEKYEVRPSETYGVGMFAVLDINGCDFIGFFNGPVCVRYNLSMEESLSNPNWFGFKTNHWIDPKPPFRFINHSCEPNSGIKGTKKVHAIKDIFKGEEITFDYSISEIDTN